MTGATSPVGLVLGSLLPPEDLTEAARAGERLGFGQLWMAEDCFFAGAVSGAAVVLGATERIPVGLGIVNAMVRHPALLAMELATLARTHPGRLVPAVGLGLPVWLRQLGLYPASPLGAMRDCVGSVRRLLAGEEISESGPSFHFERVQLSFPAAMPLYMGVMGPKMLELSGEIADGTVLSVLASPAYVAWARERIAAGARRAGRGEHHSISTFTLFAVDDDGERRARASAAVPRVLPRDRRRQHARDRPRHRRRAARTDRGRARHRRARDARELDRGPRGRRRPRRVRGQDPAAARGRL